MPNIAYLILAAITPLLAAPVEATQQPAAGASGKQIAAVDRPVPGQLDAPGKVDLEAAEMVAELIGAPIFATGAVEVGHVAAICFGPQGRPERLRMTTGATLGLGARLVAVPEGAFMVLRGAVVLDLPQEAVRDLPIAAGTTCD